MRRGGRARKTRTALLEMCVATKKNGHKIKCLLAE